MRRRAGPQEAGRKRGVNRGMWDMGIGTEEVVRKVGVARAEEVWVGLQSEAGRAWRKT